MEHTAVIVESSLLNRRQLAEELRRDGSAAVIEAISCMHGLELLSQVSSADTCLLGPRLRLHAATQFLRSGRQIVEKRSAPCAFFALVPERTPDDHRRELRKAGATGVIAGALSDSTFTNLVRRAVTREITSFEHDLGFRAPSDGPTPALIAEPESFEPFIPNEHRYTTRRMETVLLELASRLEHLANEIDRERFGVRKNGVPSLATADAIRVSLEAAFPVGSDVSQIGSPGHQFIDAVVRWFELRPHFTGAEAREFLRRVLVAGIQH